MKYEVLIFDADETLFDFKKAEKYALENAIKDFNIDYAEDIHLNKYSKINDAIWKELELGKITLEKLKTERFLRFIKELELKADEIEMSEAYMNHLGDAGFLIDGSETLIKALNGKYKLVIVTNGITSIQKRRVKASPIADYFHSILISEEENLFKPDKRIFERALESINHKDKSSVLIIGDSLTSDIMGGNNAHIDTCWYNPYHSKNVTSAKPTYEVSSYDELLKLLQ